MALGVNGLAPVGSAPGGTGGGGAPTDAQYIVAAADGDLTEERVATDTATVAWDFATAAQAKASIPANAVGNTILRDSGALSVIGRSANSSGDPADISATATSDAVLRESGSTVGFGTVATAGIADNAVTNGKLRDSAALSVVGRSANSSGDPADIAASAASAAVLRESGSTIGFGTVATGGIADAAVTYAKVQNVTDARLLGRSAGSAGAPQEISIGTGLSLAAAVLSATGGGSGFTSVAIQVLAAGTTTYTPTANMSFVLIFCQGSGGGTPIVANATECSGGGGGGGCAVKLYTAAQIGASEACVIGAASTGAGNDSTFSAGGTLITGSGGAVGGLSGNTTTGGDGGEGGAGGAATGGDFNIPGEVGHLGLMNSASRARGGQGGNSFLGKGGRPGFTNGADSHEDGGAGGAYGGGAGGGFSTDGADTAAASGAAGIIIALEFIT